jgi:hypothetical protein
MHDWQLVRTVLHLIVIYSSKPIAEDYLSYLTPATHLLELRREKAEVEKALVTQKEV